MTRKWIASLSLALVAALALSACSTGTSNSSKSSSATQPGAQAQPAKKAPYRIGVSNVSVGNPWRVQLMEEFREAARNHPDKIKEVIITDAGGDANKQINDIEDLIAQKVDALVVTPASPTALVPVLEEAAKTMPVILFSTDANTDKASVRVMPSYSAWAKLTADWLAKATGGKGNIVALRGISGLSAEADEWKAFDDMLKANTGMKLVCTEFADWDYAKAKTAILNCLANNPKIDGIASLGDGMTWAAAEVMKSKGYDVAKIPMVGIGGSNGFMKFWQAEKLNAMVVADPTSISYSAIMAAVDVLDGKAPAKSQAPETTTVTSDTLSKFVKANLPDNYFAGTKLSDTTLQKIHGSK